MAVAVFATADVVGESVACDVVGGMEIVATFTKLPPGKHGFHIHVAGDLRGEGCAGACSHWHVGPLRDHGSDPKSGHTGDLGNIELTGSKKTKMYRYFLAGVRAANLWGRSLIVHADEDDLGLGAHNDSKTTGHSGARIACAIWGRIKPCISVRKTRKRR
jgi:Cu-Zn family superoxide dismutase